jgi:hypothetical protein
LAWLFIAGIIMLASWAALPQSAAGWGVLLVFGPPLYVLGELLSEKLWSSRVGRAVSQHPSPAVRIFLGVLIGMAALTLVWWISWSFTKDQ